MHSQTVEARQGETEALLLLLLQLVLLLLLALLALLLVVLLLLLVVLQLRLLQAPSPQLLLLLQSPGFELPELLLQAQHEASDFGRLHAEPSPGRQQQLLGKGLVLGNPRRAELCYGLALRGEAENIN